MNFNLLKANEIPQEFMRFIHAQRNHNGVEDGVEDVDEQAPHLRAWRMMSKSVLNKTNDDINLMLLSYKESDSKFKDKIKEFTYGKKVK